MFKSPKGESEYSSPMHPTQCVPSKVIAGRVRKPGVLKPPSIADFRVKPFICHTLSSHTGLSHAGLRRAELSRARFSRAELFLASLMELEGVPRTGDAGKWDCCGVTDTRVLWILGGCCYSVLLLGVVDPDAVGRLATRCS